MDDGRKQAFEWNSEGGGKHWKWFHDHVEELSKMGITAAWLPRKPELYFLLLRKEIMLSFEHTRC